jgi:hypothetical protein
VQAGIDANDSTSTPTYTLPHVEGEDPVGSISGSRPPFRTPLDYSFLQFIISENITSDTKLANADSTLLGEQYTKFLSRSGSIISSSKALELAYSYCQEARRLIGLRSRNDDTIHTIQRRTRLDKDPGNLRIMNSVPNLCKDEQVDGLPKRTIFTMGESLGT